MRIFKMLFYSWHNNETIRLRLGSAASQKIGTFSKHDGNVNGSLLCRLFFSPSPTRRKKITSADPSDLLSSNMGIWRCNCFLGQSEFTFQILLSDATAANLAIKPLRRTRILNCLDWQPSRHLPRFGIPRFSQKSEIYLLIKVNNDCPRRQLHRHIETQ